MVLPDLLAELREQQPVTRSVILCGIETHACIHHTTLDLLEMGIDVHIPVDCVSSRSMTDRKFALERLRQSGSPAPPSSRLLTSLLAPGAFLTTSECVILSLAPDAAHPTFKQLQKLVMEPAADTGLL